MKFTLSWLKEHLETDAAVRDIENALNQCGFEVENIDDPAHMLAPFAVAHVVKAEKHPNADTLSLCRVETHKGTLNVVCGAPNVRSGINVIVAFPGTFIPGTQHTLKIGTIRGIKSEAMICSERELMISDDHDGIIEVGTHIPIGTSAADALELNDAIFEIAVTPNRPDALGVRGIARDLSAKGIGTLKNYSIPNSDTTHSTEFNIIIQQNDDIPQACTFCAGRVIKNVTNKPSPKWLQQQLINIGLRPLSALVDITNYITFTFARPLHAFDADTLAGKKIIFRHARNNETIKALDGKTYTLDDRMTLIADAEKPISIAGIIGGEETGCKIDTKNILLESAYFNPIDIAQTGRKLDITSDARFRFERGVDPLFVEAGIHIATKMILDICGGEPSDIISAGKIRYEKRFATLRKSRVASLGGMVVGVREQKQILDKLGIESDEKEDHFLCAIPSWRPDMHGEEDLVEEICRIYGIEHAAPKAMRRHNAITKPILTFRQKRIIDTRRTIAARAMNEVVTWSFMSHQNAQFFGGGHKNLQLVNPISSALSDMRPSLIPNLLEVAKKNHMRGIYDLALFETGQIYYGTKPEEESFNIAGIRCGMNRPKHWQEHNKPVDLFDVKADVFAALSAAGAPVEKLLQSDEAPDWFTPGRSGVLKIGHKNIIAHFGEIHPRVLKKMDIKGAIAAFEILLDAIPVPKKAKPSARARLDISNLQTVTRDFAFILDKTIPAHDIITTVKSVHTHMHTQVMLFDVFAGVEAEEKFGKNKKSIAIEVVFTPKDKTLTDADIVTLCQAIIGAVQKKFEATLRA